MTTYSYKYTIPGSVEICVPELQSIDYSDTTPYVTYTHNRLGQLKTAVRAGMTATYDRNLIGQVKDEAFSGGTLSGLAVKHDYDAPTRLTTLRLVDGTTTLLNTGYVYDTSSRLDQVTDNLANSHFAKYAYSDNSRLVSMVRMTNNASGEGSRTDRAWDKNNRLTGISSRSFLNAVDTGTVISREYGYNAANQRIAAYCEDGTYWVYNYDSLGQVTSGRKYWADGSEVAGQQFEYRFDDIGNRDTTGGRASAVSDYSANRLNQISTKTTPTKVDVIGVATASSGVDVWKNSDTAISASRKGEYFHAALDVVNSTYPAIKAKSLASGSSAIDAGKSFVPIATEAFTYDDDGNLTADGRWNAYAWDGENRLKEIRRGAANPASPQGVEPTTPSDSLMRLLFEYDYLGRRIRKTVQTITGSAWVTSKDTIYLYDEWNVIAELSTTKVIRRSYAWGTDLSGSMYGAGGVGGLLWVRNHESAAGPVAHAFTSYDGNGNVMGLFSALDGSALARYEYGPFGETIRFGGALAVVNPIRWSSTFTDAETGLSYYGHRYFNASVGVWLNRDPITEKGGINVYGIYYQDFLNEYDMLGLACCGEFTITELTKAFVDMRTYL